MPEELSDNTAGFSETSVLKGLPGNNGQPPSKTDMSVIPGGVSAGFSPSFSTGTSVSAFAWTGGVRLE